MYMKHKLACSSGKAMMYSIVIGKCTKAMKAKLEAEDDYEAITEQLNVIRIFKMIRDIAYDYESERYPFMAVVAAKRSFYTQFQKYHTANKVFLEQYNNM